jgi:hypothetical protein
VLARAHQSGSSQIGQVPRGSWLRHVNDGHEITNAKLSALKEMKDSQPSSIRKRPELQIDVAISASIHAQKSDIISSDGKANLAERASTAC